MHWRAIPLAVAAVLLLSMQATEVDAEIYKWTDESGAVHYTQDLSAIPSRYRDAARSGAQSRVQIQTYSRHAADSGGDVAPAAIATGGRSAAGKRYRIPFTRQGTLMKVDAQLNNQVSAPFLIDSGASHISIPYWVAEKLGIRIDGSTPRRTVRTANGLVSEPIVSIDTVQLGGARVDNLQASVSTSMTIGLLGGSFFNNFIYQVDTAAGEIILEPNDRVASGLSEDQWRARFLELREPLARLETVLERGDLLDDVRVRELEQRRVELRGELEALETQATRSQVPQKWRR